LIKEHEIRIMKHKRISKAPAVQKDKKTQFGLLSQGVDALLQKGLSSLILLGALSLVAFFVRLSFLEYYKGPLTGDAAIYAKIAWGIKNGYGLHWWSVVWSPFYPFVIFFFSVFTGSLEAAALVGSLVLGSLVVVPFFFLAKNVLGYKPAYLGSVLVVFFPALVVISAVPLSEATYTFFFLFTLLLGWLLISKRSYLYGILLGILSGICYLTRPEFLVAFAAMLLVFFIFDLKRKAQGKSRTIVLLLLCLAGFFLSTGWYVNFMHTESNHWILSGKTAHNILKHQAYSQGMSYQQQRKAFAEILDGLTPEGEIRGKVLLGEKSIIGFVTTPGFVGNYISNAWNGIKEINLFFLPFLLLSLFYMFSWKVDKEGWRKRIFLLCAFSPILTMPVFFNPAGRLIEPYSPLLILLSVGGILNLRTAIIKLFKLAAPKKGINFGSLVVILIVVLLSIFSWVKASQMGENHQRTFRRLNTESEEFKKLGLWADRILPKDAVVMYLSGESFFFYCNRRTFPIPFAGYEKILSFARKNKVDYLIASLGNEASWREDLSFLLEPLNDPSRVPENSMLSLIDLYQAPSGLGAVLYKFTF
jgi:4-amino-4-deoxy-L-arabinose transferase-like glycosyltransferase